MKKANDLESILKTMIKEGRKEQRKTKTFGESRTARERRVAHNIMTVKTTMQNATEKTLQGLFKPEKILATVERVFCESCRGVTRRVAKIEVISHARHRDEIHTRITDTIGSKTMLEFHQELPLVQTSYTRYTPLCVDCLDRKLANGSERIES